MSVIVELTVPSEAFELGQILRVEPPAQIALETMVPLGGQPTPFIRSRNDVRETFETSVRGHSSVEDITEVNSHNGETLYALRWNPPPDSFLRTIMEMGAVVLNASGDATQWGLEVRFPDHEKLSAFHNYIIEHDIPIHIDRTYTLSETTEHGHRFDLSQEQREALLLALRKGYFETPSEASLDDLADELGITRQALSNRIRRANEKVLTEVLLSSGTRYE